MGNSFESKIGKKIKWELRPGNNYKLCSIDNLQPPKDDLSSRLYESECCRSKHKFLKGKKFVRLSAERDIKPELHSNESIIKSNGGGIVNIIQKSLSTSLICQWDEEILLKGLNRVFSPSIRFIRIAPTRLQEDKQSEKWEIQLQEEGKNAAPLSQMGSGLKTVLHVLALIHLLPGSSSNYIFGFEELENNLHPALFRGLLSYLAERSEQDGCIFFLTTHSHIAIDFFSKTPNAQIIHVTHDGEKAICQTVKTYVENKGILDDLDVRASDLLLSNGVIWVEGPSDRIYFNKWIEIWSNGELQEGRHYQCVFYGGSLLAHLSSKEPEEFMGAVSILRVSRNAIIIMDSDKRCLFDKLKTRVQKIELEAEQIGGVFTWITDGKEIENYIPVNAVESLLDKSELPQVEQYEDFFEYLETIKKGSGSYRDKKPLLASKISQYLTKENIREAFDLPEQLEYVCATIKQWNGM
jgi:putative ATP-dependent endonuclease of the OLD family